MSLLKTNEIQNYNGSTLTLTASTVSTSAQLNTGGNISVTGSLNVSDDSTTRTNLGLGSMATQNANAVAITGGTINTVQPATGQSLTIKDEDGNTAITIGTDNTAVSYLSLNFGSYHGGSGGAGSGTLSGNTLSDYEFGTWTPTVIGTSSAGSGTYLAQNGRYTKIGNVVTATAYLNWTAHTGTGNMQFSGLPFTVLNATNVFYGVSFGLVRNVTLTASNLMTAYAIFNQTTIGVEQYPIGGGNATAVALDTSAEIMYTITYFSND